MKNIRSISWMNMIVLVVLGILTLPLFFDVYRGAAFNIMPHDDYVPYLLYLLGEEGGAEPFSPSGYRLLSVAVAIPFYHILPRFSFTNLEGVDDTYLQALEALSLVTYLSVVTASFVIYLLARNRFRGPVIYALLAALISTLTFRYTAIYGIDPISIMWVCLLLYRLHDRMWFTVLLVLSIGINEKIVFLFFMLFVGRYLFSRYRMSFHTAVAIMTFAGFFLLRAIIGLPGNEYMVDPGAYVNSFLRTLRFFFNFKSLALNLIPIMMTASLYFLAYREHKLRKNDTILFTPLDILPFCGLLIICLIMDLAYTTGRIILFCFPLYLPLAALGLQRYLEDKQPYLAKERN
jgi:hypothetical protein